jgi:hypothetical protein
MTPKEKAKHLYDKFIGLTRQWDDYNGYFDVPEDAKECAIFCTIEVLDSHQFWGTEQLESIEYWQQVKKEIELL